LISNTSLIFRLASHAMFRVVDGSVDINAPAFHRLQAASIPEPQVVHHQADMKPANSSNLNKR
jgi:hypothetical protein